ncbi:MAG TPA: hypothetical protein VFG50_16585 [Rhodothermales bacterium]|nr:hypothetical protein [Rhodothermales bacterium]
MQVTYDSKGVPDGIVVPASFGRAVIPFLRENGYRVHKWADLETGPAYIVKKSGAKTGLVVTPQEGDTDYLAMAVTFPGLMGLLKRNANRQLRSELIETIGSHLTNSQR